VSDTEVAAANKEVISRASRACEPVAENVGPSPASRSSTFNVAVAMELVVAGCCTMRDEFRWELPPSATQGDGPDLALCAFRKLFFGIARLASIANRLDTNAHDRQQIDDALDVLSEDWPGVLAFVEQLCQDGRTQPSQVSFLFSELAALSTSFGFVRQNRSLSTVWHATTPVQRQRMSKGTAPPSSPHLCEKKLHDPSTMVRPRDPHSTPVRKLPADETDGPSTPRMSTLQEPDSVKGLQSALPLTGVDWPEKPPVVSSTSSMASTASPKAALDTSTSSWVSTASPKAALDDVTVVEYEKLDAPATKVLAPAATAIPPAAHTNTPAEISVTVTGTPQRSTSAPIHSTWRLGRKVCITTQCPRSAPVGPYFDPVHQPSAQTQVCKQLQSRGLVGQRVYALEAKLQAVGGAKPS